MAKLSERVAKAAKWTSTGACVEALPLPHQDALLTASGPTTPALPRQWGPTWRRLRRKLESSGSHNEKFGARWEPPSDARPALRNLSNRATLNRATQSVASCKNLPLPERRRRVPSRELVLRDVAREPGVEDSAAEKRLEACQRAFEDCSCDQEVPERCWFVNCVRKRARRLLGLGPELTMEPRASFATTYGMSDRSPKSYLGSAEKT